MFTIVKSDEALEIKTVNVLLYGEPGSGKTSLACTSENPLTLDFDKGVHRSEFRKDVFVVQSWKQINGEMNNFLKLLNDYNTIIIDTVGTLLDYMSVWIIEQEPSLATPKQKWTYFGKLKDNFTKFIGLLNTLGKDIIMISHIKEKDEGDVRIKRPQITGGSYDTVLQKADFVGFLFLKENKKTLDFNPCEYWFGKNSAKFQQLTIPDFSKTPDFFTSIMKEMKSAMNRQLQAQTDTINLIKTYQDTISGFNELDEINDFLPELTPMKNGVKKQVWEKVLARAKELSFEFNKDEKKFFPAVAKTEDKTNTEEAKKSENKPKIDEKPASEEKPMSENKSKADEKAKASKSSTTAKKQEEDSQEPDFSF